MDVIYSDCTNDECHPVLAHSSAVGLDSDCELVHYHRIGNILTEEEPLVPT